MYLTPFSLPGTRFFRYNCGSLVPHTVKEPGMNTYRIEIHGTGLDLLACSFPSLSSKPVKDLASSHQQGTLTRDGLQAAAPKLDQLAALRGAIADECSLYVAQVEDAAQPLELASASAVEFATLDTTDVEPDDDAQGLFVALDWLQGSIAAYQLQAATFDANNLVLMQRHIGDLTDEADEIVTACIYASPEGLRRRFTACLEQAASDAEREALRGLLEQIDDELEEDDYDADDVASLLDDALDDLREARGIEEEGDDCQWFLACLGDLVCTPLNETRTIAGKSEVTFEEY